MELTPPALTGFVKLHRSLLRFRWFQNRETLQVFLYLLLCASFRSAIIDGVALAPGQVIAGRKSIAAACGLSERQVRTALSHLQSTGTIAIQATNRYSIITLTGWEKYQAMGEQASGSASGSASDNRPHRKNIKNVYEEEKEKKGVPPHDDKRLGRAGRYV